MTNDARNTGHNPEAEWFGYESVSSDAKTERVKSVFSSVASNYDLMNDLMSAGLHRAWKDHFCRRMRPRAGQALIDCGGGTGDIALRLAQLTKDKADITVCDINADMLQVGREKAINQGYVPTGSNRTGCIQWVEGNAEQLPFDDQSADQLCIVFALRNVTRIDTALAEFYRVLKPGGRFSCMEFSPSVRPLLKTAYDLYSFSVLPWLGEKIAHDRASYQYLAESIRQFPTCETLSRRIEKVGFSCVNADPLMGGVVYIHSGLKA